MHPDAMFVFGSVGLGLWLIVTLIKKVKFNKTLFFSVFIIYLSFVAALTLFPMPLDGSVMPKPHNFIPFRTIAGTLSNGFTTTAFVQIVGNIIIATPYGVAIEIIARRLSFLKRLLLAVMFPLIVESAQYGFGLVCGVIYRSFDIDDFFLNMLGVFCGYLVFKILPKPIRKYFDFYNDK